MNIPRFASFRPLLALAALTLLAAFTPAQYHLGGSGVTGGVGGGP